jgi:hypothetical protein
LDLARGDEFHRLLVRHLCELLACEYAEVGILAPRRTDCIRTLALISHGKLLDNIEYDLAHTPCKNVVSRELCIYPRRVAQRFPEDRWLVDWQVESYAGTPLFAASRKVLGLICVMSKSEFADPVAVGTALQFWAPRTAAEIERQVAAGSLPGE